MKSTLLSAAGMLTAALAVVPAGAQTQSRAPVTIQSCTVIRYTNVRVHPYWYPWGPTVRNSAVVDGIQINYVNRSPKTAVRIAFDVDYRGDVQRIVDTGTFSRDVTIAHTFGQFSGDAYLGPQPNTCRLRAVRFADGSFWRAPYTGMRQSG